MDPGYVECSSPSFLDTKLIMTGTAWISWQRPVAEQLTFDMLTLVEALVLAATSSSQRQVAPAILIDSNE